MAAIGFVGLGTINCAVATGLLSCAEPAENVIVSPRNAAKAAALKAAFPKAVKVAQTNQEVVDGSTWVFVAVLPAQMASVLGALAFSPRHRIISLIAGVDIPTLAKSLKGVDPAHIVIAVPLPPVAHQAGVTVLHPGLPEAVRFFNLLGTAVPVADPEAMKTVPCITCVMGSYYAFLQTCHHWLVANGVDKAAAATYVGALLHSIALDGAAAGKAAGGFEGLIAEQTPGGFNEMGIRELREAGVWDELNATLTSIQQRWQGKAQGSGGRPKTPKQVDFERLEARVKVAGAQQKNAARAAEARATAEEAVFDEASAKLAAAQARNGGAAFKGAVLGFVAGAAAMAALAAFRSRSKR
jgi:pyrroline-5-carboxylate reductase